MAQHAPGRSDRTGLTIVELLRKFPDNETAERWFEQQIWGDDPVCPNCGCMRASRSTHPTMPWRCKDCRKFFSVKKGTVMESAKVGYQAWAIVIYMATTNLKGVSSMKIHRELGMTQKTAWFLIQRVREAFIENAPMFAGMVEIDETYIGGKEANKHESKKLYAGRGAVGKATVVGAKDRETNKVKAEVVEKTDAETLQGFVMDHVLFGTPLYTDEHKAYSGLEYVYDHETVKHSVGEYVNEQIHVNGMESFWATLKRGIVGVYHHVSKKHLQRYVNEFTGRHNIRGMDTLEQMSVIARGMVHKRLRYIDLIA